MNQPCQRFSGGPQSSRTPDTALRERLAQVTVDLLFVNAGVTDGIAPGWVQTDLGGPAAPLTIGQSIPGVADTIEAQAGKGGLQYLDYQGQTVRW
jgi:hypothetical protein